MLIAVLAGIVLGMMYAQCSAMQQAMVQQNQRLLILEKERAERLQFRTRAKTVFGTVIGWLKHILVKFL